MLKSLNNKVIKEKNIKVTLIINNNKLIKKITLLDSKK